MDISLVVTACGFPLVLALGVTVPGWGMDLILAGLMTMAVCLFMYARSDAASCYQRRFPKLMSLLSLLNLWALSIGITTLVRKGTAGQVAKNFGVLLLSCDLWLGVQILMAFLLILTVSVAYCRSRMVALAAEFRSRDRLSLFCRANGIQGEVELTPQHVDEDLVRGSMRSYFMSAAVAAKSLSSGIYLTAAMATSAVILLLTNYSEQFRPYFPQVVGLSLVLLGVAVMLLAALAVPAHRLRRDMHEG
ncbi:MAG: hypothetical protein KDK78_09130 [Chlamydiia bacterium]|nr:hypothetical protein [Chlamydiia bacterium]